MCECAKRAFDPRTVERLIEAPALEEALRVLQESAYGVSCKSSTTREISEKALVERLEEDYEEMNRFAKTPISSDFSGCAMIRIMKKCF